MPLHTRYVPPEQTIVVKGLQRHEVLAVKGFVARFTNALGVAVHADCADKETVRSLLYCNFRTPLEAGNALDGVVQFMLQTFPKISEHHQVPGAVLFARCVCLLLCSVCARLSVQVARAASACRCSACAGVLVQVELRVLTGALRAPASRCTSPDRAHVQVARKSELVLDKPRFSVCLYTPPWTAAKLDQYVSQVMGSPLSGIAVYDPKRGSPEVRFVRFDTYEKAKRMLALSDAGKLRTEGIVIRAVAARNTAFVECVAQTMDDQMCTEWTFEKVRAFTCTLPTFKWPPMKGNIEQVLRAVPCEFALDDSEHKLYRIRGQVQAAVETRDTTARGKPAAVVAAYAAGCDTAKTRGALVALSSGPKAATTGGAPVPARAASACADAKAAKTRGKRGVAAAKAPPCPAALPSQLVKRAIEEPLYERQRSVPSLCQTTGFRPLPWLWCEEPVPKSKEDDLIGFDFSSSPTLPTLCSLRQNNHSRYAFANATCEPFDDECSSMTGPPVSPSLSASTDIKPEDSRSMCSQAQTHINPMRSWGVRQVAEFFEGVGFRADAVRDGSVDGATLLQRFEEGDCNFFTQPAPEGLGLTKLQYTGRLRTELQRCTYAHGQAREARP